MNATASAYATSLPATWLAARMAVDPSRIDAMRRGGELIAVRDAGSIEWRYPSWQFEGGKPRPSIARIVATARAIGMDESRLYEVLTTPLGLRDGGNRLVDLLLEGREDEVVAAVRAAS